MVKVKASLLSGETLNNCSNLTLFFINNCKVIGIANFNKIGCSINIINYASRLRDFKLLMITGLYEILESVDLGIEKTGNIEIINHKLLPRAVDYVKNKNIYCEQYKEDFLDELDRKLGIK